MPGWYVCTWHPTCKSKSPSNSCSSNVMSCLCRWWQRVHASLLVIHLCSSSDLRICTISSVLLPLSSLQVLWPWLLVFTLKLGLPLPFFVVCPVLMLVHCSPCVAGMSYSARNSFLYTEALSIVVMITVADVGGLLPSVNLISLVTSCVGLLGVSYSR